LIFVKMKILLSRVWVLASLSFFSACSPTFLTAPAPAVGSLAPDFALQTLDGKTVRLSDFRGQPVLLNFWATWCGPCRLEMPAIQERYNDGAFEVLAVNFDESAALVRRFAEELNLSLPIVLDPGGQVQELYRVRGYPTSFLVDEDGVVRFLHIGEINSQTIDSYLTQMEVQP